MGKGGAKDACELIFNIPFANFLDEIFKYDSIKMVRALKDL